MIEVTIYKAKTHFYRLLNKVQKGEYVKITKHKIPVAYIVPAKNCHQPLKQTFQALMNFRKGKKLGGIPIRSLIEEGRK